MEGTAVAYDVELREVLSQPIASIRATTTPEEVGNTLTGDLSRIYGLLAQQGIKPTGPPVAVYYDFEPNRAVFESGVPIAGSFQSDGEIKPSAVPSGRAAFTRHIGPYEGLGGAHEAVRQWIEANGHVNVGPNWEIYPMPPGGEPDSAKWVTEVYWRVQ
jgi:effector-binding domain-containing protein